ncbi:MAG: DinB family protein [Ktedonobacterales bacterium]
MTTPSERYADLSNGGDSLTTIIARLDDALRARATPQNILAGLEQPGQPLANPEPSPLPARDQPAGALSRRAALKAGAASFGFLLTLGHTTPAIAQELARLARGRPMTGARLAGILRDERTRWNALLTQIPLERMEEPGADGEWSVKQLVAHLTWYEQVVVDAARELFSTGAFANERVGLRALPIDERNAVIAAEASARSVADVLAEAERVFVDMLALVAVCPTDLLNDPTRLGLPDDAPPWMRLANNSYAHYRGHEDALRAWIAG